MRPAVLLLPALLLAAAPSSVAASDGHCLSPGEASEAVASRRAVAPGQAIGSARRASPQAEVLRAALCGEPDALVYRIMAIGPHGRLIRVTVDATSGKVKAVR